MEREVTAMWDKQVSSVGGCSATAHFRPVLTAALRRPALAPRLAPAAAELFSVGPADAHANCKVALVAPTKAELARKVAEHLAVVHKVDPPTRTLDEIPGDQDQVPGRGQLSPSAGQEGAKTRRVSIRLRLRRFGAALRHGSSAAGATS